MMSCAKLPTQCSPLNYTIYMQFEWDEAKSEACFVGRGFDFAYAAHAFFDPIRIISARKANQREVLIYENNTPKN